MRMSSKFMSSAVIAACLLAACSSPPPAPIDTTFGANPALPAPSSKILPTVNIAEAQSWPQGMMPRAAAGLTVTEFAAGLDHPRRMFELPNGDILVAETNSPPGESMSGFKGYMAKRMMKKAGAGVPSANRISLLRDTDGDGVSDMKTAFMTDLFSPYGMALVDGIFYIANADGIVSVPYNDGETAITETPTPVFALPSGINHHWTKNLIASPNGRKLYAAVGSNSNIAENGFDIEIGRAAIWEYDIASGQGREYASGLRNPVGMDFDLETGKLYTVVNERDELGDNLVPDYLTSVKDGGFYGWPYSYFGQTVDSRVKPQKPDLVAKALTPDYALGAHTASLGLDVTDISKGGMNSGMGKGAFIGQHGSWNRKPRSGYQVVFIPFEGGKPGGAHKVILDGFIDGDFARGRPVAVHVDQKGGLLVSDDVGNRIWRVTKAQ